MVGIRAVLCLLGVAFGVRVQMGESEAHASDGMVIGGRNLSLRQDPCTDTLCGAPPGESLVELRGFGGSPCGTRFPSVDEYRDYKGDGVCYLRLFKCGQQTSIPDIGNHNLGDTSWALAKACTHYGEYLHVFKVKISKHILDVSEAQYTQCVHGSYGRVCGCGYNGTKCGRFPEKAKMGANLVGKRYVFPKYYAKDMNLGQGSAETCRCAQYSLPKRGEGRLSVRRAERLADYVAKGNEVQGRYETRWPVQYQWELEEYEGVIPKQCLEKHVWKNDTSTFQLVNAFVDAVYTRREPDCVEWFWGSSAKYT